LEKSNGGELVELLPGEAEVLRVHLDEATGEGVLHPPLGPEPLLALLCGLLPLSGFAYVVEPFSLEDSTCSVGGKADIVVSGQDHRYLVLAPGGLFLSNGYNQIYGLPGDGGPPSSLRRTREVLEASRTLPSYLQVHLYSVLLDIPNLRDVMVAFLFLL